MSFGFVVHNEITSLDEIHYTPSAGLVKMHRYTGTGTPDNWVYFEDRNVLDAFCNFEDEVTWICRGSASVSKIRELGFYDIIDIAQFPVDTRIYTMLNGNYMKIIQKNYGVLDVGWFDINGERLNDTNDFTSGGYEYGPFFPYDPVSVSQALDITYGFNHAWMRWGIAYDSNRNRWSIGRNNPAGYINPPYYYYVPWIATSRWDDLVAFWNGVSPYRKPDPYGPVPGPTGIGGTGAGITDPTAWTDTDDIDFPGLPGVSAVNTGFISLWSPTEQQILNLSRYMWNVDITTIDFWRRLWADPMDVIYGLHIIPVDFRATGRTIIGGTEHVVVGLVDTKVNMDYLVSQWIEVECGSLDVDEIWGAYIDYDPYTKLEIYLPYCGTHPLRVDDFMSGSISLKYKIDLLSGACVALIKATKPNSDTDDLDSIVYQFMGNCATQIPVTASQFADAVRSVMSLASSIGTMVATGVGGAAAAASKAGLSAVGRANLVSGLIGEGAAAAENVMGIKPAIERSGAIGGAAGLLAVQTPYLIITRPRQAHPENQSTYTGYPSFMTRTLEDISGWTIVKAIHLDNIPCTVDEMTEIDKLLQEGVIF